MQNENYPFLWYMEWLEICNRYWKLWEDFWDIWWMKKLGDAD